jgi:gliding motility-associated-like protein
MKKKLLFFFTVLNFCVGAQPLQEYFFNNNFTGTAGGGPLSEVLTCGAGLGSFSTQTITTSAGFFIPNVFSPNGDGLNDDINIHGFCIATFNLKIFNRWGEKIFETTDKALGWDGTFRGKAMDTGVFIYAVDGITIEKKPFTKKGNITLLR